MKALTLHPEWAHAIAHLDKRVENRDWRPPASLIGQRIAIHAGKSIGGRPGWPARFRAASVVSGIWRSEPCEERSALYQRIAHEQITRSAIVATAILGEPVEVAEAEGERAPESARPEWAAWGDRASRFWWPLREVVTLSTPIPCGGKQGFWTVPDELLPLLEDRC